MIEIITDFLILSCLVFIVWFFADAIYHEYRRRNYIAVVKIEQNGSVFYTDDLLHPLAKNAELVVMKRTDYNAIPATSAGYELVK